MNPNEKSEEKQRFGYTPRGNPSAERTENRKWAIDRALGLVSSTGRLGHPADVVGAAKKFEAYLYETAPAQETDKPVGDFDCCCARPCQMKHSS